jgi:hypothetical protein
MNASAQAPRFARDVWWRAGWARLPRLRLAASAPFWSLALLVLFAFGCGGSARGDLAGAIVLRPLAALAGAGGLLTLRADQVRAWRGLLGFAAACVALVLMQSVPLPAALFGALPGRDLIVAIGRAAGQAALARPMTLAPVETGNALWSLTVPLAALILAIQLGQADQRKLLALLLLIGAGSALLALAQINGDPAGPLYPYEAARTGGAIGLFANKNHQAVFLATLIPLLCAEGKIRLRRSTGRRQVRAQAGLFVALGLALVPFLLIADSRAGLIAGVTGALASAWAFRSLRREPGKGRRLAGLVMAGGVMGLFALALLADRAPAWRRFFDLNPADDLRYRILPMVYRLVGAAWPWGYGVGSWQKLYLMAEPDTLLSGLIMNQVHNDWLDLLVSSGLCGLMLAGWALGAGGWMGAKVLLSREARSMVELGRAGVIGAGLLAMGSLTDYPLRTPALEVELVIFAVWLIGAWRALRHG